MIEPAAQTPYAPWSLIAPDAPRSAAGGTPQQAHAEEKAAEADRPRRTNMQSAKSMNEDGVRTEADRRDGTKDMFGEDGMTFGDFLDIINPLQHIPVISTLYRQLTGDEISPGARMAGGTLFGGPVGLVSAIANNAMETHTGKDMGSTVASLFLGDEETAPDPTAKQLASLDGENPGTPATPDPAAASAAPVASAVKPAPAPAATGAVATRPRNLFAGFAAGPSDSQAAALNDIAPAAGAPAARGMHPMSVMGPPITEPTPLAAQAAAASATPALARAPAPPAQSTPAAETGRVAQAGADGRLRVSADVARQLAMLAAQSQQSAPTPARAVDTASARPVAPAAAAAPASAKPAATAAMPAPQVPTRPAVAPKQVEKAYGDAGQAGAPALPNNIPQAMMEALKKYEALHRQPG